MTMILFKNPAETLKLCQWVTHDSWTHFLSCHAGQNTQDRKGLADRRVCQHSVCEFVHRRIRVSGLIVLIGHPAISNPSCRIRFFSDLIIWLIDLIWCWIWTSIPVVCDSVPSLLFAMNHRFVWSVIGPMGHDFFHCYWIELSSSLDVTWVESLVIRAWTESDVSKQLLWGFVEHECLQESVGCFKY